MPPPAQWTEIAKPAQRGTRALDRGADICPAT